MKYLQKIIVPAIIIILSFLFTNLFSVMPATKLWKNYSVFYCDVNAAFPVIEEALSDAGIRDYICLKNQRVPVSVSEKTPEVALSLSGLEKSSYLKNRNNFFFDKNKVVQIYYIPEKFEKHAGEAAEALKNHGIFAGVNVNSAYPWFAIVICICFAVFLVYLSDDRLQTLLVNILPVYFSVMMPFYSVSSALCLFMLALFSVQKITGREGAVDVLCKNIFFLTFTGSAVLIILFTNFKSGLIFMILACAEYCVLHFYNLFLIFQDSRYTFVPVKIRPAKFVSVRTKKNNFSLLVASVCCSGIFISAVFSLNPASLFAGKKSSSSLMFPAEGSQSSQLPVLNDYINWKWETLTFPYRSLKQNKKGQIGDTVYFKRYNEKDGKIVETINSISFNENFKNSAIQGIDELNYPAVEKMLKEQGISAKYGYSSSGTQSVTLISIILMISAFIVPFIFYINIRRWR